MQCGELSHLLILKYALTMKRSNHPSTVTKFEVYKSEILVSIKLLLQVKVGEFGQESFLRTKHSTTQHFSGIIN